MDEIFRGLLRRAIRAGTDASFGYLAATLEARTDKVYENYMKNKEERLRNKEEKEAPEKGEIKEEPEFKKYESNLNQMSYQMLSILENALMNKDLDELRYAKKLSLCPMCTDMMREAERKIEKEGDEGWNYLKNHMGTIRVGLEALRISQERGIANPTEDQWREIEQEAKHKIFKEV